MHVQQILLQGVATTFCIEQQIKEYFISFHNAVLKTTMDIFGCYIQIEPQVISF